MSEHIRYNQAKLLYLYFIVSQEGFIVQTNVLII